MREGRNTKMLTSLRFVHTSENPNGLEKQKPHTNICHGNINKFAVSAARKETVGLKIIHGFYSLFKLLALGAVT